MCVGRYYTVPKKETKKFHRDSGRNSTEPALVRAVENALAFLDDDVLPVHWDREILFNMREESSTEGSSEEEADSLDSDDEDTESPEEKDHLGESFITGVILVCIVYARSYFMLVKIKSCSTIDGG